MSSRDRRIAIVLAVIGLAASLSLAAGFIGTVINNTLPWHPDLSAREHYQAVGDSYSQGFTVGFFLCFSLALAAVALGTWVQQRRTERERQATPQIELAPSIKVVPLLAQRRAG
jgi:H+/Cl- antiporter ClcA